MSAMYVFPTIAVPIILFLCSIVSRSELFSAPFYAQLVPHQFCLPQCIVYFHSATKCSSPNRLLIVNQEPHIYARAQHCFSVSSLILPFRSSVVTTDRRLSPLITPQAAIYSPFHTQTCYTRPHINNSKANKQPPTALSREQAHLCLHYPHTTKQP